MCVAYTTVLDRAGQAAVAVAAKLGSLDNPDQRLCWARPQEGPVRAFFGRVTASRPIVDDLHTFLDARDRQVGVKSAAVVA